VTDDLTIAIPRGSLFVETLELLDALGVDTGEIRLNDRRLVFPGVLTVRPSDVPTYVEHGAADLGITGKDVLMEQAERQVYELADLRYGRCRMIVASPAESDPMGERMRRAGAVRIATKYPRVASAHFTATGREAEIVEVKGSVELAPVTGLADAIVDLTATGKTLAENGLVEREAIWESTARLIANPVSHRLKAEHVDRLLARIRELR
jgi:ATP phosphoribosyltransferase